MAAQAGNEGSRLTAIAGKAPRRARIASRIFHGANAVRAIIFRTRILRTILRTCGAAILACAILVSAQAGAETTLPKARDLAAEAAAAAAAGKAYLVFFSETGCMWCERARREYLLPMATDEKMRAKLVLRQVDVDSEVLMKNFSGKTVSHRSFAHAQGVRLYPTVAFYSAAGRLAAERLIGFTNPDYYGFSIERRIEAARAAIRAR